MMLLGFTMGLVSYLYTTWFLGDNPENHPEGVAFIVGVFTIAMLLVIWSYFKFLITRKGKQKLTKRIERKTRVLKNNTGHTKMGSKRPRGKLAEY